MESSLLKLQSGDPHAQKRLVDDFQVKVYNICYSMVNNKHDAEDLMQDVFIEVLKNVDNFRGDSKLGTWIYRIAVNRSLNFIRSKRRQKWWKQIDDLLSFKDEVSHEPYFIEQGLEHNEQKLILQNAIDSLPQNQRIAFTLNKIDDLSYAEVSEVMNLGHSAVESLIHRAKIKLQKRLIGYYR